MTESLADRAVEHIEAATAIHCPVSGECIPLDDVDALIDALERSREQSSRLYAFEQVVRARLAELAVCDDPEQVTRRLRGEQRRVIVTLPSLAWDQRLLREIVEFYHADMVRPVIKVETYKVVAAEWKKIQGETGPEMFKEFKACLEKACRGRVGFSSIKIEA